MSTARGRVASRAHKAAREQMEAAVNTRLVHAGLSSHTHMHVGRWTEQLRNSKTICHHSEHFSARFYSFPPANITQCIELAEIKIMQRNCKILINMIKQMLQAVACVDFISVDNHFVCINW